MRHSFQVISVIAFFWLSACAWQRVPEPPQYVSEAPLPLQIGVILVDNPPSAVYGPGVINEWKELRLFEQIIYPYREGDRVDAVLNLAINGGWVGKGAAAGFVTGLTLGLAGTAIGPSMTGTHDAVAVLAQAGREIGRYSANVVTTVEWGMQANVGEVSNKADALQRKRLAHELATRIRSDRQALTSKAAN